MQDILSKIVADKKIEVAGIQSRLPVEELRAMAEEAPGSRRSLSRALASSKSGIIAEFKRKSPSRGWINKDAVPETVIPGYSGAGASALSILTDNKYFGGSIEHIKAVTESVEAPILRKDFIISEYQLLESRFIGADAVLLIAACLTLDECRSLMEKAHALGLEVLLEIHSEAELPYAALRPDCLGINNRNLGTFVTDVRNSFRLADTMDSSGTVLVSESGIFGPETVRELRSKGFRGFLMGENFMKEDDPGLALRNFIGAL